MNNRTFSGFIDNLSTNSKKYSFYFDGKKLNLNLLSEYQYGAFNFKEKVKYCEARFSTGGLIAFYDSSFYHKDILCTNASMYPSFYYCSKSCNESSGTFIGLRFTGKIVNLFFPPTHAIKYDSTNLQQNKDFFKQPMDGSKTIELKPFKDVTKRFDAVLDKKLCHCTLNVACPGTIREGDDNLGALNSYFQVVFDEPQTVDNLKKYYLIIYKFFQFLLKIKNIKFDQVSVLNIEGGFFSVQGEFYDLRIEKEDFPKKCCQYEFYESKVGSLLNLMNEEDVNFNYIVKTNFDSLRITQEQYIICCGAFEYNVKNSQYCDTSNDEYKNKIIEKVQECLDCIKDKNKEEREYCKHIIQILENDKNSIEQQFNQCHDNFGYAITPIKNELIRNYKIDKKVNYGKEFASFRNKKAHGELNDFTPEACCAYILGMALIDCILLDRCGYTQEEIGLIVSERYII